MITDRIGLHSVLLALLIKGRNGAILIYEKQLKLETSIVRTAVTFPMAENIEYQIGT